MTDDKTAAKKPRVKKEPPKHTDFLGTALDIDDMVAFSQGSSSTMALGRVTGFTAKSVRVEPITLSNTTIAVGYAYRRDGTPITRSPNQVVKLPSNIQEFNYLPRDWISHAFN